MMLALRLTAWPAACHTQCDDREEAQWIARAKAGDEAAYRWLLARYRARVARLAAHVLRREGDAEDAAQETFLRAFRHLRTYKTGSFFAWLSQITVRVCLDRQRRAFWHGERPLADAPIHRADFAPSTDTRLLVEALLDRLSPPMRAALVLRELEGLEYGEIADALAIPVGTVRSRLNAARAQFRELWQAATEEDDQ